MKYKMSKQGVGALMMVFQNGFMNLASGQDPDMTKVFENLEWFVNTDQELVCDNPPIFDMSFRLTFLSLSLEKTAYITNI